MANNGRMTTGSIPRALQYGLDKIIDDTAGEYTGRGDEIFTEVMTDKAYYEVMKLAGTTMAAIKGEGQSITLNDSVDQAWVFRIPVFVYEKSVRITEEGIEDNLYENMLDRIAREQLKSLRAARDFNQAQILNRSETSGYTYGDGSVLCATNHKVQAGNTTYSNLLTPALDISEDALEQMVYLVDAFINDDGLNSEVNTSNLIVPTQLRFEAIRIVKNSDRPATADRDINAMYSEGSIGKIITWKRLTDTDAFFVTTDVEDGLMTIRRKGVSTKVTQDPYTFDSLLCAYERYAVSVGNPRCIVKSAGV